MVPNIYIYIYIDINCCTTFLGPTLSPREGEWPAEVHRTDLRQGLMLATQARMIGQQMALCFLPGRNQTGFLPNVTPNLYLREKLDHHNVLVQHRIRQKLGAFPASNSVIKALIVLINSPNNFCNLKCFTSFSQRNKEFCKLLGFERNKTTSLWHLFCITAFLV